MQRLSFKKLNLKSIFPKRKMLTDSQNVSSDTPKLKRKRPGLIIMLAVSLTLSIIVTNLTFPYLAQGSINLPKAALISAAFSFMTPIGDFSDSDQADLAPTVEFVDKYKDESAEAAVDESLIPYEEEIKDAQVQSPTGLSPSTGELDSVATPAIKPANAGTIVKKFYEQGQTSAFINLNDGFLKNCTTLSADEIMKSANQKSKIKIKADGSPEVLLMHTHATESYQENADEWFEKSSSARTTDNTKNTIRVGEEIEKALVAAGIGVIHDKTLHDYPSYNGAYERSAVTIKKILKENPTIKVVLDIHRDAIQPDADTMIAPTVDINGKSCAQVMIIAGCDNGKLNMPKYKENLKFAAALQREMASSYTGLARPILFDYRKYNQDLTTGSLLLEMGGHGNTLDEAIYCGELVGKSLAETLLSLK